MILYLDTSSLVKLYVEEPGSEHVWQRVELATSVATSTVAYPETRSALARRRREHILSSAGFAVARRALDAEWAR